MQLVLHGYWRSSSSHRVRLALAVKKVAYESVAVNLLKGEQSDPELVAKSPMGRVPCLVIDGRPFVESVAIIELLDDLFPEPRLYPQDAFARAHVRALVEVVNSGIQPLQNLTVLGRLGALSKEPQTRKDWLQYFLGRGLSAFEALMASHESSQGDAGPFSRGATITAADVFLLPQVVAARRFGVDLSPFPRIQGAVDALLATEAARQAAPENQADAMPEPPT